MHAFRIVTQGWCLNLLAVLAHEALLAVHDWEVAVWFLSCERRHVLGRLELAVNLATLLDFRVGRRPDAAVVGYALVVVEWSLESALTVDVEHNSRADRGVVLKLEITVLGHWSHPLIPHGQQTELGLQVLFLVIE